MNKIDHMRIVGTEPSSYKLMFTVPLSFSTFKNDYYTKLYGKRVIYL